jgi:hypothetical protein
MFQKRVAVKDRSLRNILKSHTKNMDGEMEAMRGIY